MVNLTALKTPGRREKGERVGKKLIEEEETHGDFCLKHMTQSMETQVEELLLGVGLVMLSLVTSILWFSALVLGQHVH